MSMSPSDVAIHALTKRVAGIVFRGLAFFALYLCCSQVRAEKEVIYYLSDPQGTPLVVTDASGVTISISDTKPYGLPVLGGSGGGVGFTGHINDDESAMVYMQARYYDPAIGRFLSIDPITPQAGEFNRYSYGKSNPLGWNDPSGMFPENQIQCGVYPCTTFGGGAQDSGGCDADECKEYRALNQKILRDQGAALKEAGKVAGTEAAMMAATGPIAKLVGRIVGVFRIGASAGINAAERAEIERSMGLLREAAQRKGNFGLGSATREQAERMGREWVGGGYRVSRDGTAMISEDGLRQFRPPSVKDTPWSDTGVQANFEARLVPKGEWQSNGHLNITQ
jgi:RHS repeat-associated protein